LGTKAKVNMNKSKLLILALLIQGFAFSQEKMDELPGNTKLPSSKADLDKLAGLEKGTYKYSVEDYFAKPKQSGFKFSPNGKYFSYQEKDANGKRHVYIKDLETDKITKVLEEKEELIRAYFWANDSRILYAMDKGGNENYQLFAVDIDGKNQKALTPYEGTTVGLLESLEDDEDHIIIQLNKNNPQIFEPFKLNIKTGELVQLYENKDPMNPIVGYVFSDAGELKAFTKQENGVNYSLYYRLSEKEEFKKIVTRTWKDQFAIIGFNYESKNPHDAYVRTNMESNTAEIVMYDLKAKKTLKKVYNNPNFDVGGMRRSKKRDYEVDFFSYTGEKSHVEPVSETYKNLHAKFKKQFGENEFTITNATKNEDKFLIYTGSDRLFGVYYTYDVNKDEFKEVMNLMPQLKEEDMAEVRPITFKSRDGLLIHAYLTVPKAAANGKVPLIVNPHGGPYGVRDNWGFNPETQLFASRGYATLQINYRGSGGYGKEFLLAGSKQIGRKMLEDLEDGVAYAKTLDFINGDKVAIYGASYGGLATLGCLVKTPDLFVCGIDYVGVSNLFTFFESFPPYWKPYMGQFKEQWYDFDDEEDQKIMKAVSPAMHVEKITKPLFVVQGANDPRVNINESDQIVESMRKRGIDVPYMVKYDEGHGFGKEENSIELYKCMMGFFSVHLK
jgi:dipeptidyl aminopeptidase/acylaminoacyl peptidase